MKKLLLVLCVVVLAGCGGRETTDISSSYTLPPALSDCVLYQLKSGISYLTVMRCPNSTTSTSYQQGKTKTSTIVVDGVTYTKEK